jgi:hypothetical protein
MQPRTAHEVLEMLRRRSTKRLLSDLDAVQRIECECDGYHGYVCGKHRRTTLIEEALHERDKLHA